MRQLYEQHSGNAGAACSTVTRWITRHGIKAHGANEVQRVFDRAEILAALEADFPSTPQFISVEDAFHMARRPYPNQRRQTR